MAHGSRYAPEKNTGGNRVETIERAFALVEALEEMDGARITELAERTGLAGSTIHRHLNTLYDMGYVVKEGDIYHVGLGFLGVGEYARSRKTAYRLARPKVEELAEETNERCQFVVEEHGRAVYIHVARGSHAVETDSRVGRRLYLHSTSVGKAILANLEESRVHQILDTWGMPKQTDKTVTDRGELLEELETVRQRGIAFNREGNVEGLRSVGAAVIGPDGQVIGAFSVSGPTHRMKGKRYEETLPDLILGAANELELRVRFS